MCKEAGDAGAGVQDEGMGWEGTKECEDGGLLNNWRLHFLFTQHTWGCVLVTFWCRRLYVSHIRARYSDDLSIKTPCSDALEAIVHLKC